MMSRAARLRWVGKSKGLRSTSSWDCNISSTIGNRSAPAGRDRPSWKHWNQMLESLAKNNGAAREGLRDTMHSGRTSTPEFHTCTDGDACTWSVKRKHTGGTSNQTATERLCIGNSWSGTRINRRVKDKKTASRPWEPTGLVCGESAGQRGLGFLDTNGVETKHSIMVASPQPTAVELPQN